MRSYAAVWAYAQGLRHAHGQDCRIATGIAFSLAVAIHVGSAAAGVAAVSVFGLPRACLWWPPKEEEQKKRFDLFADFVRANRAKLQARCQENTCDEAGTDAIELLMGVLKVHGSKEENVWYKFLNRLRGKSGWPWRKEQEQRNSRAPGI